MEKPNVSMHLCYLWLLHRGSDALTHKGKLLLARAQNRLLSVISKHQLKLLLVYLSIVIPSATSALLLEHTHTDRGNFIIVIFCVYAGMQLCEAVLREYLPSGENGVFLKMNSLTSCLLHCVR